MGVVQRQGIKNAISSYLGILLGFISLIVIQPKFLKPEEIGLARVLFAISTLIASFIPLGANSITIKYFPAFKDPKTGHHGFLGFALLLAFLGYIIIASLLFFFSPFIIAQYSTESPLIGQYYYYILPFCFFIAFSTVITAYLMSLFKTTIPSYLNDIYTRIVYIFLIFAFYFKFISLQWFITGYVATYGVQLIIMLSYLFTIDKPSLKIDFSFFKQKGIAEMLMFGLLLSLSSIASLGLKTLDSVVMGKYLPLTFVGIYAIASFIPTIIETPLYALDKIVTARIAHAASENNMDEIRDVYYKSVKYLSLIGALLFVGINCNITYLLHLIGKGFQQGIEVVWIISIGSLINMMGGANTSIIFYSSRYWHGAVLLLLLVVITLISNVVLIPQYGINGAAMSTAISSLLYTAIKLVLINRKFKFQPYNFNTLKVTGIGIVCIGINYLLPVYESNILNIMVHSSVIGVTFLVLTYMLKIVPEFHRYIPIKRLR